MKTIGMIGGVSCESSAEYYRLINQETRKRLGGNHNAPSVMVTVDLGEIEPLMGTAWDEIGRQLANAARQVERGGAGILILCSNAMHTVADAVRDAVNIPFLHICDATG